MKDYIDRGREPFNYMISRPSGSVLPMSTNSLNHPNQPTPLPPPPLPPTQEDSVSPPAQALDYDHPKYNNNNTKGGNRAVIPSKRAAQNRAAQKAFRQRREQYIKDLEVKAKEMEDWQEEMDNLKKENAELRERVLTLENQVSILTGGDASKIPVVNKQNEVDRLTNNMEGSRNSPSAEPSNNLLANTTTTTTRVVNEETRRESMSPVNTTVSVKRSHSESRMRHEQHGSEDSSNKQQEGAFTPVPLRAPNQTGFESTSYHPDDRTPAIIGNDTTIENKRRKLDNPRSSTMAQPSTQQQIGQEPMSTNTSTGFIQNRILPNSNTANSMPLSINNSNPLILNMQQQQGTAGDYWSNNNNAQPLNPGNNADFDLDFDFDPFFEEEFGPTITNSSDFLPNANSGQVLDDLFAMLQTRQRPQIPIVPTDDNMDPNNNNNNIL